MSYSLFVKMKNALNGLLKYPENTQDLWVQFKQFKRQENGQDNTQDHDGFIDFEEFRGHINSNLSLKQQ